MNASVRNSLESIFINRKKSNNNNDGKNEEIHFAFIQRKNLSRNLLQQWYSSRDMHLPCSI